MRTTGIQIIGDAPWGTHFCQFYRTKQDLLDVLVPYFKAGLSDHEFCMWVTSVDLSKEEAEAALAQEVPDWEHYRRNGQIEILPYTEWYLKGGSFDLKRVLNGWVVKLDAARARGFEGLRLTGNTVWLEKRDWQSFTAYEQAINEVIGHYPMLALCTYSLEKCGANEILDVVRNHQFALIKGEKGWEVIETSEHKHIRESLQASEQRYHELFEAMSEGFALHEIICDAQGRPCDYRFLDVNPAFEQLTGMPAKQVLGKTVKQVLPQIEPFWIETFGKVALTGVPVQFEHYAEVLGRDYAATAYRPRAGQCAVLFRNITEEKKKETELRKLNRTLRALHKSSHAMIHAQDELEYLREVCRILVQDCEHRLVWIGFAEEDEAKSVRPVAYAGFEEGYLESLRLTWADTERGRGPTGTAIRTGQPNICRNMLTDPRFEPWRAEAVKRGYASSMAVPIMVNNKALGAIMIYSPQPDAFAEDEIDLLRKLAGDLAQGITALRLRQALQRANEQLEQKVAERTAKLQATVEELEHFSYSITHDMRAPLRAMQGFAQLLLKEHSTGYESPEAQAYLHRIATAAERMDYLITDALQFSKVVRTEYPLRPLDPAELLRGMLESYPGLHAPEAQIVLEGPFPLIMGNEAGLTQCFSNLLGNAVKFVAPGTRPQVRVWAETSPANTEYVRIWIQDNGIGIPQHVQEKIFHMFQQLNKNYAGTGIGLALVRKAAERMGGRVGVISEPGQGSRFWLDMKRAPA